MGRVHCVPAGRARPVPGRTRCGALTRMADIIPLGVVPDAEVTRSMLLDLQRRFEAGKDLGPRVPHIRQAAAALRSLSGGLRRQLETLDPAVPNGETIRELAERTLALAEQNLERADGLLRMLGSRVP